MKAKNLLNKIQNNRNNVRFSDFVVLILSFGFRYIRSDGSHNIYKCDKVEEIINIQNVHGEVKLYQVKQFLSLVEKYNLKPEE